MRRVPAPGLVLAGLLVAAPAPAAPTVAVDLTPSEVFPGSPATLRVVLTGEAGLEADLDGLAAALGRLPGVEPRPLARSVAEGEVRLVIEALLAPLALGPAPVVTAEVRWKDRSGSGLVPVWLPGPTVVEVPARPGDAPGRLRGPTAPEDPAARGFPWPVAFLLLGCGLLVARRLRRGAGPDRVPATPVEPPLARALRLLEELRASGDPGDPRSYHYRLSEIARDFLARRFACSALSETTEEVLSELAGAGVDPAMLETIGLRLGELDAVKFGPASVPASQSTSGHSRTEALVRDIGDLPPPGPAPAPSREAAGALEGAPLPGDRPPQGPDREARAP